MAATLYLTTKEWGKRQSPPIGARSVTKYASEGRIKGAKRYGTSLRAPWMIPENAKAVLAPPGAPKGNQNAKKKKK